MIITKIQLNKTITLVAVTALLAVMLTGCGDKAPAPSKNEEGKSSYKKDDALWQQFKAKQAVDNIDK